MEEPPEAPDDQWVLTYIKKLATYVLYLASNFLGFARKAETSVLVFGEDLARLCIQNEAARGRLFQGEDMAREHGTVWGAIRNALELDQKRAEEATVATLKTQVSKIDYFTKTM